MTQYECPRCGYDGSGYKNGREGWVDSTPSDFGPSCGKCGRPVDSHFRCGECRKHLAGMSYPRRRAGRMCSKCLEEQDR